MKINKRAMLFPIGLWISWLVVFLSATIYCIIKYFTEDEEASKESALIVNQIAQAFIF
jgi:hypothetical protein